MWVILYVNRLISVMDASGIGAISRQMEIIAPYRVVSMIIHIGDDIIVLILAVRAGSTQEVANARALFV